ncbi:hypothetical protein BH10PSE12_BH10PSE12_12350 [soil metagenome]
MRSLLIAGMAAGLACLGAPALAAGDPGPPPSHDDSDGYRDMHRPPPPMSHPMGHDHDRYDHYRNDRPDDADAYRGRWVGTWYGDDGRVYNGEYDGSYHDRTPPTDMRAPPPPHYGPHGMDAPPPRLPYDERVYQEGMGSYYYATPGGTTVIVQPGVITTTTVEEEVVYTRPARKWTPHRKVVKSRCGC